MKAYHATLAIALAIACAVPPTACSKEKEPIDWSRKPLAEVKETIAGVRVSVPVPMGLDLTARDELGLTWSAKGSPKGAPTVRVTIENTPPPRNDNEARARAMAGSPGAMMLRVDAINRGHLVLHRSGDGGRISATAFRWVTGLENPRPGKRTLSCSASIEIAQPRTEAGDRDAQSDTSLSATNTWLSNICLRLSVADPSKRPM